MNDFKMEMEINPSKETSQRLIFDLIRVKVKGVDHSMVDNC